MHILEDPRDSIIEDRSEMIGDHLVGGPLGSPTFLSPIDLRKKISMRYYRGSSWNCVPRLFWNVKHLYKYVNIHNLYIILGEKWTEVFEKIGDHLNLGVHFILVDPTSNVQRPMFNVQRPTSNVQHPMFNVQRPTSNDELYIILGEKWFINNPRGKVDYKQS